MAKLRQAGANAVTRMSFGAPRPEASGRDALLPALQGSAAGQAMRLEPREAKYEASLALTLRALAHMRGGACLLHGPEVTEYEAALQQGCVAGPHLVGVQSRIFLPIILPFRHMAVCGGIFVLELRQLFCRVA